MAGKVEGSHRNEDLKLLGCVHTKYIPNPKSLYEAIIEQLEASGLEASELDYKIKIEMKHNVYNIKSTVAIDLDTSFKEKIKRRSVTAWPTRIYTQYTTV
ncbi:hypothetical protein BDV96DRAFT_683817 [Lophiotrema nucula]|uniref:Uncharacterized protein n=1 Tax=Lophiotrema nucula TaxID=690887 RepID=A0A6A5ZN01_9PLEO|nr:hypothetical protein BDV96DRAFT_683817 [Lophiotrema nucula]